jgi:hypothetical protein
MAVVQEIAAEKIKERPGPLIHCHVFQISMGKGTINGDVCGSAPNLFLFKFELLMKIVLRPVSQFLWEVS